MTEPIKFEGQRRATGLLLDTATGDLIDAGTILLISGVGIVVLHGYNPDGTRRPWKQYDGRDVADVIVWPVPTPSIN